MATKTWEAQGWRELQSLMLERYGAQPWATCKDSTAPDQQWLSPELQNYVTGVGILDLFPDHRILIGSYHFPGSSPIQRHWELPLRIPWEEVDQAKLAEACNYIPSYDLTTDSTSALSTWSEHIEKAVATSMSQSSSFPGGAFGRCKTLCPKDRPDQAPVPKGSRPGDIQILSSFLGRSVQLWFQQRRRFQHYLHHCRKNLQMTPAQALLKTQLWRAILEAKGFRGSFRAWWPNRQHQRQGSPLTLPVEPPPLHIFELIDTDFGINYKAYETWNQERRIKNIESKFQAAHDRVFSIVKNDPKEHIDSLIDVHSRCISLRPGTPLCAVVAEPFPEGAVIGWKLNGIPAQVSRHQDGYLIDSDLLLCEGQQLQCEILIHDTVEVNQRLETLWAKRWQKHPGLDLQQWHRVFAFTRAHLPQGSMSWSPLTYEHWVQGLKHFKPRAARGPDGWSREDLLHLPRPIVEQFLQVFNHLENGHEWPRQWISALVHCIEKVPQASESNQFRPITLFSLIYRLWAGLRTSQLLAYLARFADADQCGFIPEGQASDLWWDIQTHLEVSMLDDTPTHGIVADLVKAYNLLPRAPVWRILLQLGVPSSFLECWSRFLHGVQRFFVVRGSCSNGLVSSTGFPEGCPLSCCAMVAIDILWHRYQQVYTKNCRSMSFVDNLEIVSSSTADHSHILLAP